MLIRQIEDRLSRHPAPTPEPLGLEQYNHLNAVVAELVPHWSVELQHDMHGKSTLVILPEDLDDSVGPTLVVYEDETAFHLEELRWDAYRKLGDYRVWADVLRAVRIRLIWEMPSPTTLH